MQITNQSNLFLSPLSGQVEKVNSRVFNYFSKSVLKEIVIKKKWMDGLRMPSDLQIEGAYFVYAKAIFKLIYFYDKLIYILKSNEGEEFYLSVKRKQGHIAPIGFSEQFVLPKDRGKAKAIFAKLFFAGNLSIYLPQSWGIQVHPGEKIIGGQTILAIHSKEENYV